MGDTAEAQDPQPEIVATVPLDDGADWVQVVSGEWLRGEILRVREDGLDFDSDEFDERKIDFSDVKRLISSRPLAILTEDGRVFRGTVSADEKFIWVTGGKTVQLDRGEVLSLLPLDGDSTTTWTGKLSLGAIIRSGNTDQVDYSAFAEAIRETTRTRWANSYTGVISDVNDTEVANSHRIGSTYDVFLTKRLFVTVPRLDVFRDTFQNIALRVTPAALVGYEVVDAADHTWSLSLGPAYQYQRFDSKPVDGETTDGTAAAALTSTYSWDITSDIELDFNYGITAPLPETDEFNHNFVIRLSVELLGDLDLNVDFIWDRVNKPQRDGDGNLPEQDDYRTTLGLGWDF